MPEIWKLRPLLGIVDLLVWMLVNELFVFRPVSDQLVIN